MNARRRTIYSGGDHHLSATMFLRRRSPWRWWALRMCGFVMCVFVADVNLSRRSSSMHLDSDIHPAVGLPCPAAQGSVPAAPQIRTRG